MPRLHTEIISGEPYQYYSLGRYVVLARGVCGGRPTFKYTRIQVAGTLDRIAAGEDIGAIIEDYQGKVSRNAILEAMIMIWGTELKRSRVVTNGRGKYIRPRKRLIPRRAHIRKRYSRRADMRPAA